VLSLNEAAYLVPLISSNRVTFVTCAGLLDKYTYMQTPRASIIAAAVLLFTQLGMARRQDHQVPYVHGPSGESRMIQEIRHQLVLLPYYSIFDDLAFRVDGGSVTLLGAVTRPTLKSDAENVVKRVEGVTQVTNTIEVLPLSPMDDQIRRAMVRTIYGDGQIGTRYGNQALPSIHILVKNGDVTLVGLVANQGDKNLIGIRANGVANVFHVTNNLIVEGGK
jgi:hyperosmotically inducible periplasmic protein